MPAPTLSVREIEIRDIEPLSDYWFNATPEFLTGMGVDLGKMPSRAHWVDMLEEQIRSDYPDKKSYAIIWELDGRAVGHSNINRIVFGEEAFMHLHLWDASLRKSGYGASFVKMALPFFFKNYRLKKLFCEPYALNPAPNKTLEKVGFKFVKEYITVPGFINFEQPVKLWEWSA